MPSITVTTTPVLVSSGNPNRIDIVITNPSSTTVYLGIYSDVISGTTIYLRQHDVYIDDYSGIKGYRGDIYAAVSSGTGTLNYWERDQ